MDKKTLLWLFIFLAQSPDPIFGENVWPWHCSLADIKCSDLDKRCYQMALAEDVPADETDIVVVDVEVHRTTSRLWQNRITRDYGIQNKTDTPRTFSVRLSKGQTKTEYFPTDVSMISENMSLLLPFTLSSVIRQLL